MSMIRNLKAHLLISLLVVALGATPAVTQAEDADELVRMIGVMAAEPEPDLEALQMKLQDWLALNLETAQEAISQEEYQIEGARIEREFRKVMANDGSSAADIQRIFGEMNTLTQKLSSHAEIDFSPIRKALSPLNDRYMAEIDDWFSSEKTKSCLRMSNASQQRPQMNIMQSELIAARLLDIESGTIKQDSMFGCYFIRTASIIIGRFVKTINPNEFPKLAEQFGWMRKAFNGGAPTEWLVYEANESIARLNVASGALHISEPLAVALVDAAVKETFGSYEAFRETQSAIGDAGFLEQIVTGVKRFTDETNASNDDEAFKEAFAKKIFGDSPQQAIQSLLNGGDISIETNPMALFGSSHDLLAAKFEQTLDQLLSFALLHEMGHIELGHDRQRNPSCDTIHSMEYEADAFAASYLGRKSQGVPGLNLRGQTDGLKAFFSRYSDFGFANDVHCKYPPIEKRFERITSSFQSAREKHGNSQIRNLQNQVANPCATVPESIRQKCVEAIQKTGLFGLK